MRRVDLGWARIFVEVARAGSLTEAAARLNVTQPAVSYQIRRAEAEFGCALVVRGGRGVTLTEEGRALFEALARAVDQVDALAARTRRGGAVRRVRLFTDYAFASLWLLPRLEARRAAPPGHELQIVASQDDAVGALEPEDLAVVFRRVADAPPGAVFLIPEAVLAVCAPGFVAAAPDLAAPDLAVPELAAAATRRIHLDGAPDAVWLDWPGYLAGAGFGEAGVGGAGPPSPAGPRPGDLRLNTYAMVVEAALAGQGVALGWRGLVDRLLARGALVPAGPEVRVPDRGYLLLAADAPTPAAAEMRDWLIACGREGDDPPAA